MSELADRLDDIAERYLFSNSDQMAIEKAAAQLRAMEKALEKIAAGRRVPPMPIEVAKQALAQADDPPTKAEVQASE